MRTVILSDTWQIYNLSAAYDLLNVHLVINDNEELALSLDGKKSRIKRQNFVNAMKKSQLDDKTINNIFKKFVKVAPKWYDFIDQSFLPEELTTEYKTVITHNLQIIER